MERVVQMMRIMIQKMWIMINRMMGWLITVVILILCVLQVHGAAGQDAAGLDDAL